jgi:hypothetical protein
VVICSDIEIYSAVDVIIDRVCRLELATPIRLILRIPHCKISTPDEISQKTLSMFDRCVCSTNIKFFTLLYICSRETLDDLHRSMPDGGDIRAVYVNRMMIDRVQSTVGNTTKLYDFTRPCYMDAEDELPVPELIDEASDKLAAFCMGQDNRLGENSWVNQLSSDLIMSIFTKM